MPVGDASAGVLADIDDGISSTTTGMRSKKVSKLLPYPGIRRRHLYRFEGEEVVKFWSLNRQATELAGLRSFESLAETDVILSSLEAAVRSIFEATSWVDWWTFMVKSMALRSSQEVRLIKWQCVAGARCQLLVAKIASTVWANLLLKRQDAVLTMVKDSIFFESFMDLCNCPLSGSPEPFPAEALEKEMEKSSRVLHNKAIRKAVSVEKPAHKPTKKLYFSQPA